MTSKSDWPPEKPGHYLCERCGGRGMQEAGVWNHLENKFTGKAGMCQSCNGEGYLGKIVPSDNSSIDEEPNP